MNGSWTGLDDFRGIAKESHNTRLLGLGSVRIRSGLCLRAGMRQSRCLSRGHRMS
jgi:hypothetical protein